MNILALDTSSKYLSLVIAKDDIILTKVHKPYGRELSVKIVWAIERALQKSGLNLEDIDYFGFGLGPGSFTALRIGLATLKGLVFSSNKPLVAVSSLEVIARPFRETQGLICPIIDAKRELLYTALYNSSNGRIKLKGAYLLVSIEELLKKIDQPTLFLGDGLLLYRKAIERKLGPAATCIEDPAFWIPSPENLLSCVRERILRGDFVDSDRVVPLYLYHKACQVITPKPALKKE